MAKTNDIIQTKECLYMNETIKPSQEKTATSTEAESAKTANKELKFKEVVCANVPASYFRRAKKQKLKY